MMIENWGVLNELAEQYGDSFFVLNGSRFRQNFTDLRNSFQKYYKQVNIGYSYKTNYTPQLCMIVNELGGYAEVVSEMEYALAKKLDIPSEKIIYNGPYKSAKSFADAIISGATVNLDSDRDLKMLLEVAACNPSKNFSVVVRTNFDLGNGDISRFGMDVSASEFRNAISKIAATHNISLAGLHCHFPDRQLDSFESRIQNLLKLTHELFPNHPPEILNIGGGYFSNMPDSLRSSFSEPPATFDDYASIIGSAMNKAFSGTQKLPKLFLEPGTAIVADTQNFYTRIINIKSVRGRNFAGVAGSGFDISPVARSKNLPVHAISRSSESKELRAFDVVGFTCIEKDILTENFSADLEVGDFLRYSNVGSYSVVMRPPFILPSNPILFEDKDSDLTLIKSRQTVDQVFQNFEI